LPSAPNSRHWSERERGPYTGRLGYNHLTLSSPASDIWLASGLRTPFARVDGPFSRLGAI
jgi:hypothetical protein